MLAGDTFGCIIGVFRGPLLGSIRLLDWTIRPLTEIQRTLPSPAIIPPQILFNGRRGQRHSSRPKTPETPLQWGRLLRNLVGGTYPLVGNIVWSPLTAASATFALKADAWYRRGRLFIVVPVLASNIAVDHLSTCESRLTIDLRIGIEQFGVAYGSVLIKMVPKPEMGLGVPLVL